MEKEGLKSTQSIDDRLWKRMNETEEGKETSNGQVTSLRASGHCLTFAWQIRFCKSYFGGGSGSLVEICGHSCAKSF